MKRNLLLSFSALAVFVTGYSQSNLEQEIKVNGNSEVKTEESVSSKPKKIASNRVKPDRKTRALRKKHEKFLANSPFKKNLELSKTERKAAGLPPNKFYERQFELTVNPATGRTEEQNVFELQKQLADERLANRTPGDASDNNWVERGPTNVGGRTRVLLFDPNDATNKRVFAGAASGGLWVKTDITTTAAWTRVAGVPGNLNVSCITVDPNNSNIWYLGTGEQYTFGDAVGNGVYKTTDGGTTWVNVPVSYTGSTYNYNASNLFVAGIYYVHDIIAWNNAGNTEVFIGVGAHIYGSATPNNWTGLEQTGLYKTTNGGTTWTRNQDANLISTTLGAVNHYVIPNDLEKDAAGNLWFSTTNSPAVGIAGGKIFKSTNGTTWTLEETIATADRTEIEPSSTNANKFYVLAEDSTTGEPKILMTTDAFATAPSVVNEPDDADTGISATDFTRGQAFYDLVIECDPTNDAIVYIGGIDLFRSTNSGGAWTQISKWSNNNNLAALTCSIVHADQHVMAFRPGSPNEAVFGNDGGVFYASSLSTAGASAVIPSRNASYNVTQFYSIGVAPTTNGMAGDNFVAGAQDNGSQMFLNASAGAGTSATAQGGDGAFSFFDEGTGADRYRITNYVYNASINLYNYATSTSRLINDSTTDATGSNYGAFICPMGLDSSLDILYSDYTTGTTYQIRRYSNVKGPAAITRTTLSNALLTGAPTAFKVSKYTTASTTLLVGCANGRVLLLTNANGAPTWTNITGPSFVGSVSDVEFGASENDIFVTFHNYSVVSVWYSADRGVTWQNKEGNFPNIPVKTILQNPLNPVEVIIGTDLGVWYTNTFNTASPVWLQSYNGMSNVKVTDLQLRNDNAVYAATFGRGVFSGIFTAPILSTNENSIVSNSIKVYPTVSNGNVTISTDKTYGKTNLELFDITGKNVYSNIITLDTNSQEINLGSLTSGNYILKMKGDSFEITKRLIIE